MCTEVYQTFKKFWKSGTVCNLSKSMDTATSCFYKTMARRIVRTIIARCCC